MAIMKARLKGAQKGHSLLKKKADALTMRFRAILKKIIEVMYQQLYYISHVYIVMLTTSRKAHFLIL